MNFEFMTIDTPLPPCMPFPRALTGFPVVTRLKNDGLLAYRWEESPSGPPRKYYSITDTGRAFLVELHKSWQEISHTINHLININTQTTEQ